MISFAECATAEISNDGSIQPLSILRQCRNALRQETSRVAFVGGPTNIFEIIICLLNTYTPSSPLIVLINTCVLGVEPTSTTTNPKPAP